MLRWLKRIFRWFRRKPKHPTAEYYDKFLLKNLYSDLYLWQFGDTCPYNKKRDPLKSQIINEWFRHG